jgi:PAS domain S-box-containing protein
MMKYLSSFLLFALSFQSQADIFAVYRNPNGTTRWQYIANTSLLTLIVSLSIVAIFLFVANRRARKANLELTEMKITLEERVAQRTASLKETAEQLKHREAYIASVIESMPIMLIGLNDQLNIIQWNHVAESATGRSFNNVKGKNLWDVYPTLAITPEQVKEVIANKTTSVIKHCQREQYYFDITLYSLTDVDETSVVILIDDITKQMKAENRVAERDKISAMGELTSAMAYDINLPLKAIANSLLEAQKNLPLQAQQEETNTLMNQLQTAQHCSQQASAIIQNLMELANSHQDQKTPSDIPSLMDKSILTASELFTDTAGLCFHKIKIVKHYSENLPTTVCFSSELEQVFVRLLRNAYHALNTQTIESPEIHVSISEFYDSLWIKVQHNGAVLSEQEQIDIFQPYFSVSDRLPATPVEHRLSYSYFIITDHHDGQMSVTSSDTTGTTFNIQLPLP